MMMGEWRTDRRTPRELIITYSHFARRHPEKATRDELASGDKKMCRGRAKAAAAARSLSLSLSLSLCLPCLPLSFAMQAARKMAPRLDAVAISWLWQELARERSGNSGEEGRRALPMSQPRRERRAISYPTNQGAVCPQTLQESCDGRSSSWLAVRRKGAGLFIFLPARTDGR